MKKISSFITAMLTAAAMLLSVGVLAQTASDGEEMSTVTLIIRETVTEEKAYLKWTPDIKFGENATILSLFEDSELTYETDDEGNIVRIGDFANGSHNGAVWRWTVNGAEVDLPAVEYLLNNGDRIVFEYGSARQEEPTAPVHSETTTSSRVTRPPVSAPSSASGTSVSSSSTAPTSTVKTTSVSHTQTTADTSFAAAEADAVAQSLTYLRIMPGDNAALVFAAYRRPISESIKQNLEVRARSAAAAADMFETAEVLINADAAGMNTADIGGADLQNNIKNSENIAGSGFRGMAMSALALSHCAQVEGEESVNTPTRMMTVIMQNQNPDGGFAETFGADSDVYLTALAVTALSDYRARADVAACIDRALLWLLNHQFADGSFPDEGGEPSAVCTASVVIALNSCGLGVEDERFVKEDNPLSALMRSFNGNAFVGAGGFEDIAATESALLAIYSNDHAANPYTCRFESKAGGEWLLSALEIAGAVVILIVVIAVIVLIRRRVAARGAGANNALGSMGSGAAAEPNSAENAENENAENSGE